MDARRITFMGAVVIAVVVYGCTTTPMKRQERTATTLGDITESLEAVRSQIDRTQSSLKSLVNTSPANLKDAYTRYASDVDTMAKQADVLRRQSQELDQRSNAWLSAWQKSHAEIQNPELKAISEGRRSQALHRFDAIKGALAAARQSRDPFMANLQDIKNVVGNDLTPRSLDAVSRAAVVQNAQTHGTQVARSMDVAIAELRAVEGALVPVTPK